MEKSELSTRDRMCSVAGGMARWFIDREVPSRLIPFRGEFPLLDTIETKRFREAIRSTMWIEELPPKLRYAAAEGSRMARLEEDFRHYLSRYEVTGDDFETWDEAEKSRWLRDWMKAASVSEDDLTVKKYREEAASAPEPVGDPTIPDVEKREIDDDRIARRVYWDDLCSEFGRIDWEEKLRNLALYIHYGGDLEAVLTRYKASHPDYADRVPFSLAYYISYLRTGRAISVLNDFLWRGVALPERRLAALLSAELHERLEEFFRWDGAANRAWTVRIDYEGEKRMMEKAMVLGVERGREFLIFGNLTIKPFTMETKETLLKENPWLELAEKLKNSDYRGSPDVLVCSGDRTAIEAFNETADELHKIRLEGVPEPVHGRFFNAKVALLTLNPGWVECTDKQLGNDGTLKDGLTAEKRRYFLQQKAEAMLLKGRPFPTKNKTLRAIDTDYWNKLLNEVLNRCPDATKYLTIIQYLGYHSKKYKDIGKRRIHSESGLLPTQEFAARLVRYLMNKGVLIVICRSKKRWFAAVEGLENYSNLVLLNNYRRPYLSPNNCADDGFDAVIKALKE